MYKYKEIKFHISDQLEESTISIWYIFGWNKNGIKFKPTNILKPKTEKMCMRSDTNKSCCGVLTQVLIDFKYFKFGLLSYLSYHYMRLFLCLMTTVRILINSIVLSVNER